MRSNKYAGIADRDSISSSIIPAQARVPTVKLIYQISTATTRRHGVFSNAYLLSAAATVPTPSPARRAAASFY